MVAYPNPAADYIYLSNLTEKSSYMLMDMTGKIVLKGTINDVSKPKISINHLENGMYFLQCNEKVMPFYKN
ncbi:MAG: T9SS type A sorting domain-containing protein [Chitinophagales bacterium]